ncbi:MAG: CocE/NonD family hydrolase [Pseudomonadota bacterium]
MGAGSVRVVRRLASSLLLALVLLPAVHGASETPNYERRAVEIPMRDGVTLHTVIVVPNGAKDAPLLLTRTPYGAEYMTSHAVTNDLRVLLQGFDNVNDVIVDGGYIRVVQDIRGKNGSGGDFTITRPLKGTALNTSTTDESTDAYDTIEWLVKNVPESNGKVGIIGVSYDGFLALMALVDPHPALKVAVPMDPMVDGWMGDDWFHNGAFRQLTIAALYGSDERDNSGSFPWNATDIYDVFMRAGSVGELARQHGMETTSFWKNITDHPAYDEFWEPQAVDKLLAARSLTVPVMLVSSLWDQEDIYGAPAVYRALEPQDKDNRQVYLTIGPWAHGQSREEGSKIGNLRFDHDTAKWWRTNVLAPFLAHYLKGAAQDTSPVTAFQSGTQRWQHLAQWPPGPSKAKLYLKPGMALGFEPVRGRAQSVEYVSDPAKPVPFVPRPIRVDDDLKQWQSWLTSDQRHAGSRPDVLTFSSDVLADAVTIAGEPFVNLTASTSGTDSDWVVKLIDVYPDQVAGEADMGGYQLPIAMQIFRGRYRESLSQPKPLKPNAPLAYRFALPQANHVFLPGHRIMVQVQSSWFGLYDRNPQTFVPNIFVAKPADYVKATQKVIVAGPAASYVELPIP